MTLQSGHRPRFSIILPSYNYASTLSVAVDSVLSQTVRDWELVVVDDGSSDGSLRLLERREKENPGRIRLFRHPDGQHRGIRETYRLGFSVARGTHLAFLEADDIWKPENLENKLAVFKKHTSAGLVFSAYSAFGSFRRSCYWHLYALSNRFGLPSGKPFDPLASFLLRNPAATFSAVAVRRDCIRESDWNSPQDRWTDWWFFAHLAQRTLFYYDCRSSVHWRIHGSSANAQCEDGDEIRKIQDFLIMLYDSLLAETADSADHRRLIEEARTLMQCYRNNLKAGSLRHHLLSLSYRKRQGVRFLTHLFLKKLLLSRFHV